MQTTVTHIGTATMFVESGGLTFLTDRVFYPVPVMPVSGLLVLRSAIEPAMPAGELPSFSALLLSNDEPAAAPLPSMASPSSAGPNSTSTSPE